MIVFHLIKMINDALLYGIVTLGVGVIALTVRYCFRSKCTDIQCCYGLVSIKRDIASEVDIQKNSPEEEKSMELRRPQSV